MHSIKKMVLNWKTNYQLEARNEHGIFVKFDVPIDHGGKDTALSPIENVLASLAACSSFHVLRILKKMRQKISNYSVEATAERREEPPPRVFTRIHLEYILKGQKNQFKESRESNPTFKRQILFSWWSAKKDS